MGDNKNKIMTPLEISEYKRNWMRDSYKVNVHSDLVLHCKRWCSENLNRFEWHMKSYTDIYEYSFYFEHDLHAKQFAHEFSKKI